ncbi:acetylglutamate kinase [Clostridium sp. P21]|uniref:Acetylglutamate kinase n=1 Tax=Clostridium muellerianum TaxID=2716538 RepID=A0A7Y0ED92_9CLOT|nr:acetylglutamate kinase [Clostridium muellerianum]NMM61325.1 acetylglutamate kinase [Clostridium muellerianum]
MINVEEIISLDIDPLPYMKKFVGKTFVIKYGGSIMKNKNAAKAFIEDIVYMKLLGINVVIVHGGGPEISKWIHMTGMDTKFVNGLRVTDEKVMDVVEMVLSGHINKDISANLSKYGISAIGLSGRDSNLIKAKKKYLYNNGEKIDIGFVGKVVGINKNFLSNIIEKGRVAVVAPIGCDSYGNKYNINADYAASFISSALKAEKLIILTDVEGVYTDINDKDNILKHISSGEIKKYIDEGVINGGMIPKMECCIEAIEKGTKSIHLVDGRKNHGLILDIISGKGTKITLNGGINQCQKVI